MVVWWAECPSLTVPAAPTVMAAVMRDGHPPSPLHHYLTPPPPPPPPTMTGVERHCLVREGARRWRCQLCNLRGHEKRTRLKCRQCCVALCLPCFTLHHQDQALHPQHSPHTPPTPQPLAWVIQVCGCNGHEWVALWEE